MAAIRRLVLSAKNMLVYRFIRSVGYWFAWIHWFSGFTSEIFDFFNYWILCYMQKCDVTSVHVQLIIISSKNYYLKLNPIPFCQNFSVKGTHRYFDLLLFVLLIAVHSFVHNKLSVNEFTEITIWFNRKSDLYMSYINVIDLINTDTFKCCRFFSYKLRKCQMSYNYVKTAKST